MQEKNNLNLHKKCLDFIDLKLNEFLNKKTKCNEKIWLKMAGGSFLLHKGSDIIAEGHFLGSNIATFKFDGQSVSSDEMLKRLKTLMP